MIKTLRDDGTALVARNYLQRLLTAVEDPREIAFPNTLGDWEPICATVQQAAISGYMNGGAVVSQRFAQKVFHTLSQNNPELLMLLNTREKKKNTSVPPLLPVTYEDEDTGEVRHINAYIDPSVGLSARKKLDEWVKFSSYWVPRAHKWFHEGAYFFLLSAIAMRRIEIGIENGKHTGLYVAFAATSGKYNKTGVIDLVELALKDCGLDWLPYPGKMTPQALYAKASGAIPAKYDSFPPSMKDAFDLQLDVAGQRPLIRDEFGTELAAMANPNSIRASFGDLLCRWEGYKDWDSDEALSSGNKMVYKPHMPVLVGFTPEHLKNMTGKGNADMWGTGVFPRFLFLTPSGNGYSLAPAVPLKCEGLPDNLREHFVNFHKRLGQPKARKIPVYNKKNVETGEYIVEWENFKPRFTRIEPEVFKAAQEYADHLKVMINTPELNIPPDLHPWYLRSRDKALRMAALLAWSENDGIITYEHYALAQTLMEEWREGAHNFYEQTETLEITKERKQENGLITALDKHGGWCTLSEMRQYNKGLSTEQIQRLVRVLLETGRIIRKEVTQPPKGRQMEEPAIYGFPTHAIPDKWMNRLVEKDEKGENDGE